MLKRKPLKPARNFRNLIKNLPKITLKSVYKKLKKNYFRKKFGFVQIEWLIHFVAFYIYCFIKVLTVITY